MLRPAYMPHNNDFHRNIAELHGDRINKIVTSLQAPFWPSHFVLRICSWFRLCYRAKSIVKVLSIRSSRFMEQITTANNFCLRCNLWPAPESRQPRFSFAGRSQFWPITCQYKNVFTPRSTLSSADRDYRPSTTGQSQLIKNLVKIPHSFFPPASSQFSVLLTYVSSRG